MRCTHSGQILLWITLGMSSPAFGQGGTGRAGRAAAAQQTPTPVNAPASGTGRGGRGGDASGGACEFYNYDTTAGVVPAIPDTPPTETHQKITVNGVVLGYTARVCYIPLRNATTGQAEAHLFYTCYAKDGVTETSLRPLMFLLGGAPGVAAAWQEFGGLGPKRMKWANDGTAGLPPYEWVANPQTLGRQLVRRRR